MECTMTNSERRLFKEGRLTCCQQKLGAHPFSVAGKKGVLFSVWAPGVKSVQVIGSFCQWQENSHWLEHTIDGIWCGFVPGVKPGDQYKFLIESSLGEKLYKADPYAFSAELRPGTASVVADLSRHRWKDRSWMEKRTREHHFSRPMNIYEVHLGSWQRDEQGNFLNYRELGHRLAAYTARMGYTHLELMPVTEHPYDGSWGYQSTGFFAPTSRYGSPEDFREFIEICHRRNIGVILDWVPGHFCRDAHGLGRFNGEKLYEKYDHQQWGTYIFDFGRPEVSSFLLSSALFWLREYHIDGLRIDGVTSMLYLNFGKGEHEPKLLNEKGTEENLQAIQFLQELNETIGKELPDVFTIAEESSAFPLVTYPPEKGGLGFHYKWNMGWMNDTLEYFSQPVNQRSQHHEKLTFSMMYAFSENYMLPLSHDEVVHGKHSLIGRMPGSYEKQFAGLRLLALYQLCQPGGKLNFMGNEFGQFIEWRYYESLEWFLLDYPQHRKHRDYIRTVNHFYLSHPALWSQDHSWDGFRWMDANNAAQNILSFVRIGKQGEIAVVLLNFSEEAYSQYRIGIPEKGIYQEAINTDRIAFGGGGMINRSKIKAESIPMHGQSQSVCIKVPAMAGLVLTLQPEATEK